MCVMVCLPHLKVPRDEVKLLIWTQLICHGAGSSDWEHSEDSRSSTDVMNSSSSTFDLRLSRSHELKSLQMNVLIKAQ